MQRGVKTDVKQGLVLSVHRVVPQNTLVMSLMCILTTVWLCHITHTRAHTHKHNNW